MYNRTMHRFRQKVHEFPRVISMHMQKSTKTTEWRWIKVYWYVSKNFLPANKFFEQKLKLILLSKYSVASNRWKNIWPSSLKPWFTCATLLSVAVAASLRGQFKILNWIFKPEYNDETSFEYHQITQEIIKQVWFFIDCYNQTAARQVCFQFLTYLISFEVLCKWNSCWKIKFALVMKRKSMWFSFVEFLM